MKHLQLYLPLLAALGSGCSAQTGDLTLTTYGEEFIEVGMPPASESSPEGVVDGWSITYDSFLIVLADIELADEDIPMIGDAQARVFDMTQAGPHQILRLQQVPAGNLSQVQVSTRPAADAVAGNATAEQVQRMTTQGWSVFAQGKAERAGITKTFAWGFELGTRYRNCKDADEISGLVVPTGGSVQAEFTIHGDHLFFDDLQDPSAVMRFDAIAAADADMDGEVTLSELEAVDLATLPSDQYGTGGDGRVLDLAHFIRDQTRSLVHFAGEGHCQAETL